MSKDPLRPGFTPGDAQDGASIDIEIANELFESFVGSASTGTPQTAIYEPSAGAPVALDDDGD